MVRLIDADELFINLDGMMAVSPTGYIHGDTVADMISDAPTVDAEPVRHGQWEYVDYGGFGNWHCSHCREICITNGDYDYCPNCGAKMDAERKEE